MCICLRYIFIISYCKFPTYISTPIQVKYPYLLFPYMYFIMVLIIIYSLCFFFPSIFLIMNIETIILFVLPQIICNLPSQQWQILFRSKLYLVIIYYHPTPIEQNHFIHSFLFFCPSFSKKYAVKCNIVLFSLFSFVNAIDNIQRYELHYKNP